MSDSLQPHVLEHARLLCIPLTPRVAEIHVHWDTLPFPSPFAFNLSQHQRFFPVSWLLALGGQSIELRQKCFQWIFRLVYFRIDCFDLLAVQGTLKSLLQHYNSKHWSFSFSISSSNEHSGLIGLISLKPKGLSRVFSNTTVQKHQFFGTQLSL